MFCNIFSLASGVTLFHCCCRYSSAFLSLSVFLLSGRYSAGSDPAGCFSLPFWNACQSWSCRFFFLSLVASFSHCLYCSLLSLRFFAVACNTLFLVLCPRSARMLSTMPASLCSTQFSRKTSTVGGVAALLLEAPHESSSFLEKWQGIDPSPLQPQHHRQCPPQAPVR